MNHRVTWLIGRGASIACGLDWSVPSAWEDWEREQKVSDIKQAITDEMNSSSIDTTIYKILLEVLSEKTVKSWRHLFVTTNWDYLLQREIANLNLEVLPNWLANSHVFHVNGTAENLVDNSNRSPFLLEDDPPEQREFTPEAGIAFSHMIWETLFVVIGMSFECQMDKFLLGSLNTVEDDLPIGESHWILVNSNHSSLDTLSTRICDALPRCTVEKVNQSFESWVAQGMKELCERGALNY